MPIINKDELIAFAESSLEQCKVSFLSDCKVWGGGFDIYPVSSIFTG